MELEMFTGKQHDLWKQIQKQIENEPTSFEMGHWCEPQDKRKRLVDYNCGTSACIAGWAVLLAGHQIHWVHDTVKGSNENVEDVATRELGLNDEQASTIFFCGSNERGKRLVDFAVEHGGLPDAWHELDDIAGRYVEEID